MELYSVIAFHFFTEPMLIGMCNFDPLDGFSISCMTSLDETQVPLTYTCSYNDGPEEDCMLPVAYRLQGEECM